ncbi:hypothetical protein IQ06DRAFT_128787 [Phaeosphaeriaceae sp. SRC1lsM3a]|nr:hypothetical protein IQ06DRAFT_128787 [Stagonospora sp. SRC1lsM3a]
MNYRRQTLVREAICSRCVPMCPRAADRVGLPDQTSNSLYSTQHRHRRSRLDMSLVSCKHLHPDIVPHGLAFFLGSLQPASHHSAVYSSTPHLHIESLHAVAPHAALCDYRMLSHVPKARCKDRYKPLVARSSMYMVYRCVVPITELHPLSHGMWDALHVDRFE